MSLVDVVAVILFVGITAYAVFGGADFGAGFWDLTAGGARRGARPRALIDASVTPVWEANHVWLIFCLVVLWTGFPEAFASIMRTLFVPLSLTALGIVLRGSGFAFRHVVQGVSRQRLFGGIFALSSVLVPYCMGAVVGGIVSGRVPAGGEAGDTWGSWVNPTSILGGVLAVCACAYIAAVFLVFDSRHRHDGSLEGYFLRRAVGAAIAVGVVATVGIFVLRADARPFYDDLTSAALVPVVGSAVLGVGALALLLRGAHRGARVVAVAAVVAVIWAWGIAQYPYILPYTLELDAAAAPSTTLWTIIIVFLIAAVLVLPSLALLYVLDQRELLEGPTPRGDAPASA